MTEDEKTMEATREADGERGRVNKETKPVFTRCSASLLNLEYESSNSA